jgi:hypothetical protein
MSPDLPPGDELVDHLVERFVIDRPHSGQFVRQRDLKILGQPRKRNGLALRQKATNDASRLAPARQRRRKGWYQGGNGGIGNEVVRGQDEHGWPQAFSRPSSGRSGLTKPEHDLSS